MQKLTNRFSVAAEVCFPKTAQGTDVLRWLNVQYTGKSTVPLTESVSKGHRDATHTLFACRRVHLVFQINKQGEWSLVETKMI